MTYTSDKSELCSHNSDDTKYIHTSVNITDSSISINESQVYLTRYCENCQTLLEFCNRDNVSILEVNKLFESTNADCNHPYDKTTQTLVSINPVNEATPLQKVPLTHCTFCYECNSIIESEQSVLEI